jgi:hypothetical protein
MAEGRKCAAGAHEITPFLLTFRQTWKDQGIAHRRYGTFGQRRQQLAVIRHINWQNFRHKQPDF